MSDRSWSPVFLPADVPLPTGAYSPAVRAGDCLYVSGQVPRNVHTGALVGTTVEEQAHQVLGNLRDVLAAGGATLADVVAATIYLTNEEDWGAVNDIWKGAFSLPYPSRTTVGARLRGILIEVSAVAYLPR
ncbi:MAG: RidA family protein [Gemmatimonadaceae bacterium]|nr:RidA family protein [Gemmatimonadaceae bacterium]